ncbi:hypothetical protein NEMIN01_1638 [Nematocida minor]|uniref:uncharacterized protein n=1 Tax=Nematocida minor TaxID=1912983 RepID=UPI002220E323|nr:uncharacterized protein NEMIN01_1638 [Nematocida minor]KAI5191705.1 hypothetical protein NEMIN01_1638 [Nematocida minor]
MILQRILKKLIIGVAVLACLQRAKGAIDSAVLNSEGYWKNRRDYLRKEMQIRSDLLFHLKTSRCEDTFSETHIKNMEIGEENLSNVQQRYSIFNVNVEDVLDTITQLRALKIADQRFNAEEINEQCKSLRESVLLALDNNDAITDKIKKFDEHMLELVKCYSGKIWHRGRKIEELTLFKLAKNSKPFASTMVYDIFIIEMFKPLSSMKNEVAQMLKRAKEAFLHSMDFSSYEKAVLNEIEKGETDLFALADKHFHILFRKHGVGTDVMNIYFSLITENMKKEEINRYIGITPGQVIKMIMLECAMSGHLIDYRRNDLFFNLGKVIVRAGKPADESLGVKKEAGIARERQDAILDALHLLWNAQEDFNVEKRKKNIEKFCKDNGIEAPYFENTQKSFMFARWMYKISVKSPSSKEISNNQELFKKHYFVMSYTHPMCYVYLRSRDISEKCDNVSYQLETSLIFHEKQFARYISGNTVRIRPNRIDKARKYVEQAEIMKNCIRLWYLKNIEIVTRKDEIEEYRGIAKDFKKHLDKSQYVDSATIDPKNSDNGADNESNPLQMARAGSKRNASD